MALHFLRSIIASDLPANHAVAQGLPDADHVGRALVAVILALGSPDDERAAHLSAIVPSPLC